MARWLVWSPNEGAIDSADSREVAEELCDDLKTAYELDVYPVEECPDHEQMPREGYALCEDEQE